MWEDFCIIVIYIIRKMHENSWTLRNRYCMKRSLQSESKEEGVRQMLHFEQAY